MYETDGSTCYRAIENAQATGKYNANIKSSILLSGMLKKTIMFL